MSGPSLAELEPHDELDLVALRQEAPQVVPVLPSAGLSRATVATAPSLGELQEDASPEMFLGMPLPPEGVEQTPVIVVTPVPVPQGTADLGGMTIRRTSRITAGQHSDVYHLPRSVGGPAGGFAPLQNSGSSSVTASADLDPPAINRRDADSLRGGRL